jgi:hypothetical protein
MYICMRNYGHFHSTDLSPKIIYKFCNAEIHWALKKNSVDEISEKTEVSWLLTTLFIDTHVHHVTGVR